MRQALDIPKVPACHPGWLGRALGWFARPRGTHQVHQLSTHLLRDIGLRENGRINPLLNERNFLR